MNTIADISLFTNLVNPATSRTVVNDSFEDRLARMDQESKAWKRGNRWRNSLVGLLTAAALGGGSFIGDGLVSRYPGVLNKVPVPVARTLKANHDLHNNIFRRVDKDQADRDLSLVEDSNARRYQDLQDQLIQTEGRYDTLGLDFAAKERELSDKIKELDHVYKLLEAERENNARNVSEINRLNAEISRVGKEINDARIAKDNLWQMYRGKDSIPESGPTPGAAFKRALAKQLQTPRNFLRHLGNYLGSDAAATPHY